MVCRPVSAIKGHCKRGVGFGVDIGLRIVTTDFIDCEALMREDWG